MGSNLLCCVVANHVSEIVALYRMCKVGCQDSRSLARCIRGEVGFASGKPTVSWDQVHVMRSEVPRIENLKFTRANLFMALRTRNVKPDLGTVIEALKTGTLLALKEGTWIRAAKREPKSIEYSCLQHRLPPPTAPQRFLPCPGSRSLGIRLTQLN